MVSPFLLWPALVVLARAAKVNFDDRSNSWTLSPLSVFGTIGKDELCQNCTSQPDPDLAFGGTWRDCTSRGTATLTFTGVGVTIYTICPGPHQGGVYAGHFAFSLDGKEQEEFKEAPEGCNIYRYNYPVYTVAGLSKGTHTISITNIATEDGPESNLLLDYAVVDDGGVPASTSTSLPVAAIVVPVLIILLCSVVGMWFLVVRKRRMQREEALEDAAPLPYKSPSVHSFHGTIPMTPYMNERRSPDISGFARVQVGNDPELEAALRIIASRSRQPAISPPASPTGPTGFPRDRKGPRSNPSSQNTTPQNSALGANWSTDVGGPSPPRSDAGPGYGNTPPAYGEILRRHY